MDELYKMGSLGYVEIDDAIWFPNQSFNALIKIDKQSGQIRFIDMSCGYDIWHKWLYTTVYHVDGKLVFVPGQSEEILCYDISTEEYVSVKLDTEKLGRKKLFFLSACVNGHYVYMMPRKAKCIIKYDAIEHSVQYLKNELNDVIEQFTEDMLCFAGQFEVVDDKIYIPFVEWDAVAVFDMKIETVVIKPLNIGGGCSTINYVNGCFYMASYKQRAVYCWNVRTDEIKTYRFFLDEEKTEDDLFVGGSLIQKKLFLFPAKSNMIISLNLEKEEILKKQIPFEIENGYALPCFVRNNDNGHFDFAAGGHGIYSLEYENGRLRETPYILFDDQYNESIISSFFLEKMSYSDHIEQKEDVKRYIELLTNSTECGSIRKVSSYGSAIYNRCL